MTSGQKQALEQIREIEKFSEGGVSVVTVDSPTTTEEILLLDVSLNTSPLNQVSTGIPLRDRERMVIMVPPDFPYTVPRVETRHIRFAGRPHVQWAHQLCLYQAPDVEWDPNDGMYGFIERLWKWFEKAAMDELDPVGGALHPPVAYTRRGENYFVVPRVDTPVVGDVPWLGYAHLNPIRESVVEIDEWIQQGFPENSGQVAACILLTQTMPWEFPSRLIDLVEALESRDIDRHALFKLLQDASLQNKAESPLYVVIGTPMRGIRGNEVLKQHLTAWRIDRIIADSFRLIINKTSENKKIRAMGEEIERLIIQWANRANISWCRILEDRPEIVTRRDHESPLSIFQGKTVAIWGCGALGGQVAIHLARAGVERLILYDNSIVTPGVLTRQPYDNGDIGKPKVDALAAKLCAMRSDTQKLRVIIKFSDVLTDALSSDEWADCAHIVFDCTASRSVRVKLEEVRKNDPQVYASVASLIISQGATHGFTVVATPDHTGGPADVYRSAKIDVCRDRSLRHFADAFYPTPSEEKLFQPEPGCSSPTFRGSSADVGMLSAHLLNVVGEYLIRISTSQKTTSTVPTAFAHYISQPRALPSNAHRQRPFVSFEYGPDKVTKDPCHDYQIRTSLRAQKQMRCWINQSRDRAGPDVETGGLSFGEINDTVGVIWITEMSGPPADSDAGSDRFICGTAGTHEAHIERERWSRGSVRYVGMWHTHPNGLPRPSHTDIQGMASCLINGSMSPRKSLLSIVGMPHKESEIGTYVFGRDDFDMASTEIESKSPTSKSRTNFNAQSAIRKPEIGLALSGGGSRAIAFHLGCLRALNRRGVLDQIGVISAVSGGAVLAAMYAYSNDDFNTFDKKVCALLRRGLQKDIILAICHPIRLVKILSTIVVAGMAAKIVQVVNFLLGLSKLFTQSKRRKKSSIRFKPPFLRWASRTTAFESVLRRRLFGNTLINEPCRSGLDVVINATELRTGTAFRFGSRASSNWRLGTVQGDISVATAVTASAAYPILLPSLHKRYRFQRNDEAILERVILTDGGIYDNLGTTCLDSSRNPDYASQIYPCEHLICCNAGYGQWDGSVVPYGWLSRTKRSIEAILRKGQDRIMNNLFKDRRTSDELKTLILPYLGTKDESLQRDANVGNLPQDFVTRDQVMGYPTDFRAMSEVDLELISRRGEQLTNLLLDAYW